MKKGHWIIILISCIMAFGLGAIRTWGSMQVYYIVLGSIAFMLTCYIIYYFKKNGTVVRKKNDTIE